MSRACRAELFDSSPLGLDAIAPTMDGPVEFVDTRNNKRNGTKKLVPVLTVKAGRPFGRPPLPIPFTF